MKTLLERQLDEAFLIEGEWDNRLGKPAIFNPMSAHELAVQDKKEKQRQYNFDKEACLTGGGEFGGQPKVKYTERKAKELAAGYFKYSRRAYFCTFCLNWHLSHRDVKNPVTERPR